MVYSRSIVAALLAAGALSSVLAAAPVSSNISPREPADALVDISPRELERRSHEFNHHHDAHFHHLEEARERVHRARERLHSAKKHLHHLFLQEAEGEFVSDHRLNAAEHRLREAKYRLHHAEKELEEAKDDVFDFDLEEDNAKVHFAKERLREAEKDLTHALIAEDGGYELGKHEERKHEEENNHSSDPSASPGTD
ncbi:hypothetical protein BDP27DRAFT_1361078 [Rhodocollybia butyracea]|uniref:Uncharacterized protein n=1 Tax=Rhodocollybia butyracea TaxID=206335 RepID=A0A9P5Q1R9_9AGAR|nr:hypothetical protein BDP27DRAFT_1361078 [Rhodocollybia butyracea]